MFKVYDDDGNRMSSKVYKTRCEAFEDIEEHECNLEQLDETYWADESRWHIFDMRRETIAGIIVI